MKLIDGIDLKCPHGAKYRAPYRRPQIKASLATQLNQRVQTDLFFLWDDTFYILVDECTRYKASDCIKDNSFEVISVCDGKEKSD